MMICLSSLEGEADSMTIESRGQRNDNNKNNHNHNHNNESNNNIEVKREEQCISLLFKLYPFIICKGESFVNTITIIIYRYYCCFRTRAEVMIPNVPVTRGLNGSSCRSPIASNACVKP